MPREIKEFKGNCLLVGGGWCKEHFKRDESWRNPEEFYTVDIDEKAEPDLIANIMDSSIISTLDRKFDFVYFEYVPAHIATVETFTIIHNILTENGVFLFHGGSRELVETIPELLVKAGFVFSIKKEMDPNEPKTKFDKGSLSLGSKAKLITRENIPHLSKAALCYIDLYKFFSSAPYSYPTSSASIIKQLHPSENELALLYKKLEKLSLEQPIKNLFNVSSETQSKIYDNFKLLEQQTNTNLNNDTGIRYLKP